MHTETRGRIQSGVALKGKKNEKEELSTPNTPLFLFIKALSR